MGPHPWRCFSPSPLRRPHPNQPWGPISSGNRTTSPAIHRNRAPLAQDIDGGRNNDGQVDGTDNGATNDAVMTSRVRRRKEDDDGQYRNRGDETDLDGFVGAFLLGCEAHRAGIVSAVSK